MALKVWSSTFQILPTLNSIVDGIPNLKENHEGVCKGCALGKNTKRPFGSSVSRPKEILDLIHSGVCGPMTPKSLGGHLYYVTFVDDHSRKTWAYLMKNKDEVFTKFQEFKAEVENLTKRRIKILRSDNGGEYTSKEIITFYKESGTKKELIVPYNPEQNGVAKRKNRSIEESVKAVLHDQDLPKFVWGEVTKAIVYIQNRCPHKSLDNKTPKGLFTRKNPSVDHLRIFGCPVYIHIPKEERKKLDPSSIKGIFVGYSNSSKAYRIYMISYLMRV